MSSSLLRIVLLHCLVLLSHHPGALANELSRCCAGGARHYRNTLTCTDLRSSASPTCQHGASVCCLRAVLDAGCTAGVSEATSRDGMGEGEGVVCSTRANDLAGGVRRECCECCLLARQLVERGEPCRPADGFSPSCVASFNKCCERRSQNSTATHSRSITSTPAALLSCDVANCEHFCNLRADGAAECSCRTGYELAEDGRGCVDRDECLLGADSLLSTPPCDPWHEICVNTPGGYGCRPLAAANTGTNGNTELRAHSAAPISISVPANESCPQGYHRAVDAVEEDECEDVDECSEGAKADGKEMLCYQDNSQCLNLDGGFSCVCQNGFYWSNAGDVCVDVDECLLLVDDCTETQRCLNTPGSYKCIRTLTCGTGYALDGETESCVDVDECSLGSHDCGALYVCRNTPGSYRCDPKRCAGNEVLDTASGQCTPLKCSPGYAPSEGRCEDVDECATGRNDCGIFEKCVNTEGSFRCERRGGNRCGDGFVVDSESVLCVDRDECSDGSHTCGLLQCINLVGSFKCRCPAGFEFNESTRRCEDVDECRKFAGHTCSLNADCENTVGSFRCHCRPGYQLASDLRTCEDVDECATGAARCQHKCVNTPGSYQCMCNRGYQLGMDETSCEDIDECSIWAKSGNDLCMDECVNTHGSFMCRCPPGYELQVDGVVCKDIDECAQGACQGSDKMCVNTLGSFKCHAVECPRNYVVDRHYKNRCVRKANFCQPLNAERCKKHPVHISWHHIAIPKQVNLSSQRTSVTLFSMKGPASPNSTMQFELKLLQALTSGAGVAAAVRSNFLLQKGEDHNSAVIALRDSLDGPQEVQLELTLQLSTHGVFNGKYIANLHIHVSQYKPQSHNRHNPLLGQASDAHLGL